jgi:hypothetical protein
LVRNPYLEFVCMPLSLPHRKVAIRLKGSTLRPVGGRDRSYTISMFRSTLGERAKTGLDVSEMPQ